MFQGRPPHLKIGKNKICLASNRDFSHKIPQTFSILPPLGAIFVSPSPLAWNPGSAPDIDLNMYIINVIADDESKIGLHEIYFLND